MQRIAALLIVVCILALVGAYLLLPGGPLSAETRCAREVETWLEELSPLLVEWQDLVTVTSSTSRIAVSPLVREMQGLHRDVQTTNIPECAIVAYAELDSSMRSTILAFTGFMAQEPDSVVSKDITAALQYRQRFWRQIDKLQESPEHLLNRFADDGVQVLVSLLPRSPNPRDTYINGYDPASGERLASVQIVGSDGEPVAHLEHGDAITVTKIEGPNCHITTEAGVRGIVACAYTQLPAE